MKKIVLALMVLIMAANPSFAYNKHSERTKCLFTLMIDSKSCDRGFGLKDGALSISKAWLYPVWIFFGNSPAGDASRKVVTDVMTEFTPDAIYLEFLVNNTGFRVSYKTREKVERLREKLSLNNGSFHLDLLFDIIPDELRIVVGAEFALLTTMKVGAIIVYKTEDRIKEVVKILKDAYNKGLLKS